MLQSPLYRVEVLRPDAHLFRVTLLLNDPDPAGERFTLPAWIPGSYMIRDFARHIVSLEALCAGRRLPVQPLDKQTWQVEGADGPLEVVIEVYAWDRSVRGAHLDRDHGFFNGTSLFLRVPGRERLPQFVELVAPAPEAVTGRWQVATTLPVEQVDGDGFGRYRADDYAHLVDCPVEMGVFERLAFQVRGVPHEMIVRDGGVYDARRLETDLQRICEQETALFGELPVARYLFLVTATRDGYGGLEHRDSSALVCARHELPAPGLEKPDAPYRRFLGLCAHEYFHLWNVKRIRPERLVDPDLSAEVHTRLLWAFEGITSYYDDLSVVRAGCITPEDYLETLAHTITRVMRGSGRHRQSVAESSFHAWTRFYRQDENAPNAIVSYYAKGALVALGLDVTLRERSGDRVSLDHLMRRLWQVHGRSGRGVAEDGIRPLAAELLGAPLDDFFARYVEGTEELPLGRWLDALGIGYRLRPARTPDDEGGHGGPPLSHRPRLTLGARVVQQGDCVVLRHVFDGGPAQQAGLAPGDRLVALGGWRVTRDTLDELLQRLGSRGMVEGWAFRDDRLLRFELQPSPAPADTCDLWQLPDSELDPTRRARRRSWLGS